MVTSLKQCFTANMVIHSLCLALYLGDMLSPCSQSRILIE